MELRERAHGIVPHFRAFFGRHAGEVRVCHYAAVEELHDVKRTADNGVIFTEAVDAGHRDVGVLQGIEDAVFALDFVGCLADEFAGGFLAEDELRGFGVCKLVGGVALAETEL